MGRIQDGTFCDHLTDCYVAVRLTVFRVKYCRLWKVWALEILPWTSFLLVL